MSTRNSPQKTHGRREQILREFARLKSIRRFDELVSNSLPIAGGTGYLVCVSHLHLDDDVIIGLLAKFRTEATTFHNKFHVTIDGTKRWLSKALLEVPDRILFLVLNRWGHVIGHLGFAHADNTEGQMEIDNVIRGVPDVEPGLMSAAMQTLLRWAEDLFAPQEFILRTLDDNNHAIHFYSKLGFKQNGLQALRRIETNGEINHVPLAEDDKAAADRYFVCMHVPSAKAA